VAARQARCLQKVARTPCLEATPVLAHVIADGAVVGGELSPDRQVGRSAILAKRDRIRDSARRV